MWLHCAFIVRSLTSSQYAFFFSFPVVFGEDYAYNDGIVGIMFCSVFIGLAIVAALCVAAWFFAPKGENQT